MQKTVKRVQLDNNSTLVVERGRLDEERTEAVFQILSFIAGLHDAMDLLKGTQYYSAGAVRELDRYADTKLKPIFKQANANYVADSTVLMTQMFAQICKRMYALGQQPQAVQDRFDKEMNNLFISCGVYLPDFEPIQI